MICLYTTKLPSTNDDAQLNLPAKIMHLNQQNFNASKYQIYTFMFVLEQHGWIQLQLIGESSHSHTASAYICQLVSQYEFRKFLYFLCKSNQLATSALFEAFADVLVGVVMLLPSFRIDFINGSFAFSPSIPLTVFTLWSNTRFKQN